MTRGSTNYWDIIPQALGCTLPSLVSTMTFLSPSSPWTATKVAST